ncbi:MAG: hypothetical protein ACFFDI_04415 [Promethearchaeota archaeon]
MSDEKKFTESEWHKTMAKELYNKTWELLEKKDRTPEEEESMVHMSHASRFHWSMIGEPINFYRGEWQLARVYTVLGRAVSALHHAKLCLKYMEDHSIGDFDRAYAYEAMARASAAAGEHEEFEKYFKLAKDAGEKIEKKEDQDWFLKDLDSGPWFGMK